MQVILPFLRSERREEGRGRRRRRGGGEGRTEGGEQERREGGRRERGREEGGTQGLILCVIIFNASIEVVDG